MVQQLWITLLGKQGIEGLPIESAFEDLTVLASGSGIKEGERTISFFPAVSDQRSRYSFHKAADSLGLLIECIVRALTNYQMLFEYYFIPFSCSLGSFCPPEASF